MGSGPQSLQGEHGGLARGGVSGWEARGECPPGENGGCGAQAEGVAGPARPLTWAAPARNGAGCGTGAVGADRAAAAAAASRARRAHSRRRVPAANLPVLRAGTRGLRLAVRAACSLGYGCPGRRCPGLRGPRGHVSAGAGTRSRRTGRAWGSRPGGSVPQCAPRPRRGTSEDACGHGGPAEDAVGETQGS